MTDADKKVWKAIRVLHKFCDKQDCKDCFISNVIGCNGQGDANPPFKWGEEQRKKMENKDDY